MENVAGTTLDKIAPTKDLPLSSESLPKDQTKLGKYTYYDNEKTSGHISIKKYKLLISNNAVSTCKQRLQHPLQQPLHNNIVDLTAQQ